MSGISALIKAREPPHPLVRYTCEDAAERRPSMNQEVGSPQTLNLPAP